MDHYYLLQFLNESLFAVIQLLQTLNRLQLSFTALKNTFPVQGLPSATVTPWPSSHSAQGACAERAGSVTVPVPAPVCALLLGSLSKQLSPSSASPSSVLRGTFCHLLLSAFLPAPKPQTLSCLQRELQA